MPLPPSLECHFHALDQRVALVSNNLSPRSFLGRIESHRFQQHVRHLFVGRIGSRYRPILPSGVFIEGCFVLA